MIRSLGFVVIGAVLVVALALAGGSAAQTVILNPSFETGDTTGWDEVIPVGGSIEVVTECDANCFGFGSFEPYLPVDGDWFAVLKTDGPGSFTTLSQTLTAEAGVVISGSAFFVDAEGFEFCDEAQVNIYVGGVFQEAVIDVGSCITQSTDWESWSFIIPGLSCEEVEITVEARIANDGDSGVDSRMGLDALAVDESACPTPTPEPPEEPDDDEDKDEPVFRFVLPTPQPNAGGGIAAALVAAANSNRNRASQQVAGVQDVGGVIGPISPPNTGDGGLLRGPQDDAAVYGAVLALTALTVIPWLLTRSRRTR